MAKGIAAIADAIARIREVLPADFTAFDSDRTVREVVVLNLFIALQHCLDLAAHWLADEGHTVPEAYRQLFEDLGARGVLPMDLARRLAAGAGLRNLIAHRYGVLDWSRIFTIATHDLDDLLQFCQALAQRADQGAQ